jgi:hypothetical protein
MIQDKVRINFLWLPKNWHRSLAGRSMSRVTARGADSVLVEEVSIIRDDVVV